MALFVLCLWYRSIRRPRSVSERQVRNEYASSVPAALDGLLAVHGLACFFARRLDSCNDLLWNGHCADGVEAELIQSVGSSSPADSSRRRTRHARDAGQDAR